MFENPGEKIKNYAIGTFVFNIIASFIGAIVCWSLAEDSLLIWLGIGILAVGAEASFIVSLLMYGFGELIETNTIISNKLGNEKTAENRSPNHIPSLSHSSNTQKSDTIQPKIAKKLNEGAVPVSPEKLSDNSICCPKCNQK